jgi:hypothetical protein
MLPARELNAADEDRRHRDSPAPAGAQPAVSIPSWWSSRPRRVFDATIVRVRTDDGLEGVGSGDYMLGFAAHEALFLGEDPLRLERHNRVIETRHLPLRTCWPLDLRAVDLAGRSPASLLEAARRPRRPRRLLRPRTALREREHSPSAPRRRWRTGFRALKIRFRRGDWRDDIAALEASARGSATACADGRLQSGWRFPWDTMLRGRSRTRSRSGPTRSGSRSTGWRSRCTAPTAPDEGAARGARRARIAGGELDREMASCAT